MASIRNSQYPRYAALAIAALAVVSTLNSAGEKVEYKVKALDDTKKGKLSDNTEASYLILAKSDDDTVTVSLAPKKAKKLLSEGNVDGFHMAPVIDPEAAAAAQAVIAAVAEPKGPSKANRAMAIYQEEQTKVVEGKASQTELRKTCIKRFQAELDMKESGAGTYYQSCKQGKFKLYAAPSAEQVASATPGTTDGAVAEAAAAETAATAEAKATVKKGAKATA